MGGAYSTIAADVVARFQRLQGKRVRFITGTDEHGEKIALSAEKAGLSPQAHCDGIALRYKELWQKVGTLTTCDDDEIESKLQAQAL
jgi:methionyl-tRNA synthetase